MLQKLWPTPFKIKKGSLGSFLFQLIVFLIVVAVFSVLMGVLSGVPIVGIIFKIVGALMDAYAVVGIVLCILCFLGILDDKK